MITQYKSVRDNFTLVLDVHSCSGTIEKTSLFYDNLEVQSFGFICGKPKVLVSATLPNWLPFTEIVIYCNLTAEASNLLGKTINDCDNNYKQL